MDRELAVAVFNRWVNGLPVFETALYKAAEAIGEDPMAILADARFQTVKTAALATDEPLSDLERQYFALKFGVTTSALEKMASRSGCTADHLIRRTLVKMGGVPPAGVAAGEQGPAPGAQVQQSVPPAPGTPRQVPQAPGGNIDELMTQLQAQHGDQAASNGGMPPSGMAPPPPPPPSPEEKIQQVMPEADADTLSRYAQKLTQFEQETGLPISDPKQMQKFIQQMQKSEAKIIDQHLKEMGEQMVQESAPQGFKPSQQNAPQQQAQEKVASLYKKAVSHSKLTSYMAAIADRGYMGGKGALLRLHAHRAGPPTEALKAYASEAGAHRRALRDLNRTPSFPGKAGLKRQANVGMEEMVDGALSSMEKRALSPKTYLRYAAAVADRYGHIPAAKGFRGLADHEAVDLTEKAVRGSSNMEFRRELTRELREGAAALGKARRANVRFDKKFPGKEYHGVRKGYRDKLYKALEEGATHSELSPKVTEQVRRGVSQAHKAGITSFDPYASVKSAPKPAPTPAPKASAPTPKPAPKSKPPKPSTAPKSESPTPKKTRSSGGGGGGGGSSKSSLSPWVVPGVIAGGVAGAAGLAHHRGNPKKHREKTAAYLNVIEKLAKEKEHEETKLERARRYGRTGALVGLGTNVVLNASRALKAQSHGKSLKHMSHLPLYMATDALAGYGIGRLVHRFKHGPALPEHEKTAAGPGGNLSRAARARLGGWPSLGPYKTKWHDHFDGGDLRNKIRINEDVMDRAARLKDKFRSTGVDNLAERATRLKNVPMRGEPNLLDAAKEGLNYRAPLHPKRLDELRRSGR